MEGERKPPGPRMHLFGRRYDLPKSAMVRRAIGVALVLFGFLGFLPVLGFWMIPLGLLVLSHDSPVIRRWRRRATVKWGKRDRNGKPRDSSS